MTVTSGWRLPDGCFEQDLPYADEDRWVYEEEPQKVPDAYWRFNSVCCRECEGWVGFVLWDNGAEVLWKWVDSYYHEYTGEQVCPECADEAYVIV